MGKITKQAIRQSKTDENVLSPLLCSSSHFRPNIFFISHPLSHLLCQPPLLTLCSSSSSLFLLFSLPVLIFPPISEGAALHARPLPLAFSFHPTSNQIHSLFHSQRYDKVIMHGPCAATTHSCGLSPSLTHTPLALMEVDVAFPLKILWMSSVRESWQPGAPPLICLFTSNQCQRRGRTQRWRNEGEKEDASREESREGREECVFERLIRVHQETSFPKSSSHRWLHCCGLAVTSVGASLPLLSGFLLHGNILPWVITIGSQLIDKVKYLKQ